jgi:hypothetical protein
VEYLRVEIINTGQQSGFFRKKSVFLIRLIGKDNILSAEYFMTCTDREFHTNIGRLIADLEAQTRKTLLGR